MCGRFGRITDTHSFSRLIGLNDPYPEIQRTYNQTPGRYCLVAAADPNTPGQITMQTCYWGFIPSWAQEQSRAMINARAETAGEKPYFRKAFAKRRCLVAADFWYEWQRSEGRKTPYAIRPAEEGPFFMAGLWSAAKSLDGSHAASGQRTFCVLTTQADARLSGIHHRMPVALTADGAKAWLEAGDDPAELEERLQAGRYSSYQAWQVSAAVNSPKNDDRALLTPVGA